MFLGLVPPPHTHTHCVCLWWLLAREFQDSIAHAAQVLSVCEPILSELCLFSREKLKSSRRLCFLDPSARPSSPQDVMSVGDEAASLCYAASAKLVFLLIQLNCNSSTLYTPAPQSTCLFQLSPCHVEPHTCSLRAVTASAGCMIFLKCCHWE